MFAFKEDSSQSEQAAQPVQSAQEEAAKLEHYASILRRARAHRTYRQKSDAPDAEAEGERSGAGEFDSRENASAQFEHLYAHTEHTEHTDARKHEDSNDDDEEKESSDEESYHSHKDKHAHSDSAKKAKLEPSAQGDSEHTRNVLQSTSRDGQSRPTADSRDHSLPESSQVPTADQAGQSSTESSQPQQMNVKVEADTKPPVDGTDVKAPEVSPKEQEKERKRKWLALFDRQNTPEQVEAARERYRERKRKRDANKYYIERDTFV